jgi:hypothetical protein
MAEIGGNIPAAQPRTPTLDDIQKGVDENRKSKDSGSKHIRFTEEKGVYLHRGISRGLGLVKGAERMEKQMNVEVYLDALKGKYGQDVGDAITARAFPGQGGVQGGEKLTLGMYDRLVAAEKEIAFGGGAVDYLSDSVTGTVRELADGVDATGVTEQFEKDHSRSAIHVNGARMERQESREDLAAALTGAGVPEEHRPALTALLNQTIGNSLIEAIAHALTPGIEGISPDDVPLPGIPSLVGAHQEISAGRIAGEDRYGFSLDYSGDMNVMMRPDGEPRTFEGGDMPHLTFTLAGTLDLTEGEPVVRFDKVAVTGYPDDL